jgi:hypothetical protein
VSRTRFHGDRQTRPGSEAGVYPAADSGANRLHPQLIDEPQLGFAATPLPDLIKAVRFLPFERTFQAIAWLLRQLTVIARDPQAQLDLADRVYAQLPIARQRMQAIVARDPSRFPLPNQS